MEGVKTLNVDAIEYDKFGRMKYHPEFHYAHGLPFTNKELEYICKYHDVDDLRTLSFAIGKTETTIANKLSQLKKSGRYEYYKNLNKNW